MMIQTFVQCLCEQARVDDRIFLIATDIGYEVLAPFANEFPDRFLNVGIAEQNAVSVAAGMSLVGKIVYVYGISSFLTMRCFEQVRLDMAYMNTNVRLIGAGGGYAYASSGTTHHSIEDISILRTLPNMTICCPADHVETRKLMEQTFTHQGPMYFRLGNNSEQPLMPEDIEIPLGKAVKLREGTDAAVIATGSMLGQALEWAEQIAPTGQSIEVYSVSTLKPFDKEMIQQLLERDIPILTLEEHNIIGGLGSIVAEIIAESGKGVPFRRMAIPDQYPHQVGTREYLHQQYGLHFQAFQSFLLRFSASTQI